jgi:hypothetical protein
MRRAADADRLSGGDPRPDQQRSPLMFAAHLAAGLAIGAAQPKAPAWAVLTAVFLPDLLWIALAGAGAEPASDAAYFDGWSHSAVSIAVQAFLFALCFRRLGRAVMLAIGLAVFSHLPLDALIHPRPIELWPHSAITLGRPTWAWGQMQSALGKSRYWWVQLAIVAPLLGFYWLRVSGRRLPSSLAAASCLLVFGVHLAF